VAGSGIATGVFTCAGAGVLGALLGAPFVELRRFFFAFNAGLALLFFGLALPYRVAPTGAPTVAGSGPARWALYAALAAIGLAIAYIAMLYLPGGRGRKAWLAAATGAACLATALDGWTAGGGGRARWLFSLNALAAAALLGAVIVATILGHWYLVRHRLSVDHLVRYALALGGAVAVRATLLATGIVTFGWISGGGVMAHLRELVIDRGFFFWTRILFGLIGPAVFACMVYETARIRSTQSATGILYITAIFVLIGEFLARFLTVTGGGPM
jgi:hypothetical protein